MSGRHGAQVHPYVRRLPVAMIFTLLTLASGCEDGGGDALPCDGVTCGSNATCQAATGLCECNGGFTGDGETCVANECDDSSDCDDGLGCNGVETCNQSAGTCESGTPMVCGENAECNDPSGQCACANTFVDVGNGCEPIVCDGDDDCDDALACNGVETCDMATNTCAVGAAVTCGDHATCEDVGGTCACDSGFVDLGEGCEPIVCDGDDDCDDGTACNGAETCDMATNACVAGAAVACTEANQACQEPDGDCACAVGFEDFGMGCVGIVCLTDEDCQDGKVCNGPETCDRETNACVASTGPLCGTNALCDPLAPAGEQCTCWPGFTGDGRTCTAIVCTSNADCDDGNFCNGAETCNTGNSRCRVQWPNGAANAPQCELAAHCDEDADACVCDAGFVDVGAGCEPIACASDADCNDDLACNGAETCDEAANACVPGTPPEVDACLPSCPVPQAPLMTLVRRDQVLVFDVPDGYAMEIATLGLHQSLSQAVWSSAGSVTLSGLAYNPVRVIARVQLDTCTTQPFDAVYELVDEYPSLPVVSGMPNPTTDAIFARTPNNANGVPNPLFKGWATGYSKVAWGRDVDFTWRNPENAYGPPDGTFGIVVLGNSGALTLTFDKPITDGSGPDFAIFENGFVTGSAAAQGAFLELAMVEVSSDGIHFVRFHTNNTHATPVGGFGAISPRSFYGLAGRHPAFYAGGFDLNELRNRDEVRSGRVDLTRITHVRIIDLVGDGMTLDSFGNPLYDPTPTVGSGGFDLDAVGVIHQRED